MRSSNTAALEAAAASALAKEVGSSLEPMASKHLAELLLQCHRELEKGERVRNAAWLDVMARVSWMNDSNAVRDLN